MKIYHAHGYVIHSENMTTGDEIWTRDSAFSEVFFSFDAAKAYLLAQFEEKLAHVYRRDRLFADEPLEGRDIKKATPSWREEYIDEYVDYALILSEITPEYAAHTEKTDFTRPPKIDRYFRRTGEERTSYFVFGEKEYEHREGDLLPEAGKKFAVGDLVRYTDWECSDDYPSILVVRSVPQKGQKGAPWENLYELAYIDDDYGRYRGGRVARTKLHEADLALCDDKTLALEPTKEPLLALQRVVKGEVELSADLKERILEGRVLFNALPSWRDIPALVEKGEK